MKSSAVRLFLTLVLAIVPMLAGAHYDPVQGRWCSRDPIGEQGGANLYGFYEREKRVLLDHMGWKSHNPGTGAGNLLSGRGNPGWLRFGHESSSLVVRQIEVEWDCCLQTSPTKLKAGGKTISIQ